MRRLAIFVTCVLVLLQGVDFVTTRTNLLTDTTYSPTMAASEAAIRLQVDGPIQEVLDLTLADTTARKLSTTGDFTGTLNGKPITAADRGLFTAFNAHLSNKANHSKSATVIISAYNCKYPYNADYTCTGVNDEVTIQNALDSLPDTGGKVIFTEGTFTISTNIIVPKKPIIIQGSGDSTVFKCTSDINMFLLKLGDATDWYPPLAQGNISFQNIKFTTATTGIGAGIGFKNSVYGIKIKDCYFEGLTKGLNFDEVKAYSISIDNNTFISNKWSIHCYNSLCHDFRVTNNKESGMEHLGYDSTPRSFIHMNTGECFEWLIEHNSIEHVKDTNGLSTTIDLSGTKNADVIISSNSIEECDTAIKYVGNFIYNSRRLSNLKVSNNSIRGVGLSALLTGEGEVMADGNFIIGVEETPVKAFEASNWIGNIYTRDNLLFNVLPENRYMVSGTTASTVYDSRDIFSPKEDIPACQVYNNTNQSVANAAFTELAFNSEVIDTNSMHDLVANNGRIVCKTAGKYIINANFRFAANATGFRIAKILRNGLGVASDTRNAVNGEQTIVNLSATIDMAVGDYLTVQVYQSSGTVLDIIGYDNNANESTGFSATQIR